MEEFMEKIEVERCGRDMSTISITQVNVKRIFYSTEPIVLRYGLFMIAYSELEACNWDSIAFLVLSLSLFLSFSLSLFLSRSHIVSLC